MSQFNEEVLAQLMLDATESVLEPMLEKYDNVGDITYVVGTGVQTYVSPTIKRGLISFKVNYGKKSLVEKRTRADIPRFITYREKTRAKYFPNPSYQDVMVMVIMHEFAHILQVLEGKRDYRGMHNKAFYECLERIYKEKKHIDVREYLNRYQIFRDADFDRTRPYDIFGKHDLMGVNFIFARDDRTDTIEAARILKKNNVTLRYMLSNGKVYESGYTCVYAKATKSDFKRVQEEKYSHLPKELREALLSDTNVIVKKTATNNSPKKRSASKLKASNIKYIVAVNSVPYVVNRLNAKSITATSLIDGKSYKVPYLAVVHQFEKESDLHRYLGEESVSKLLELEKDTFTQKNLRGKTYIYFMHNGQELKGKITRLNANKVSCHVGTNQKGTIPYSLITRAE